MEYCNDIFHCLHMTSGKNQPIFPPSIKIEQGLGAIFYCISINEATWFYNGDGVPYNAEIFQHVFSSNIHILLIQKTSLDNSGTYSCLSTDEEDNIYQGHATLTVLGKHFITNCDNMDYTKEALIINRNSRQTFSNSFHYHITCRNIILI